MAAMNLCLPAKGKMGEALVRLTAIRIAEAATELGVLRAEPVEAVHRARVALKRARSTLRVLARGGAVWARPLRLRLAGLARELSEPREAAVTAELAEKQRRRRVAGERVVLALLAQSAAVPPPAGVKRLVSGLRREAEELLRMEVAPLSSRKLRRMLRRSLARAVRLQRISVRRPAIEQVHDWRKAVIILRDQAALARAHWPQGAGEAQVRLARFAHRLGRMGDLALLVRRLHHLAMPDELLPARESLIQSLETQRVRAVDRAQRGWPRLEADLHRLLAAK